MENKYAAVISILLEVRSIIDSLYTDVVWSRFNNVNEALEYIDSSIEALTRQDGSVLDDLKILFAPTGSLQEISIRSGWGNEFIEISSKFDAAMEFIEENKLNAIQHENTTIESSSEVKYSNIQPIWHLITLTIITTGFYQMVWFYKTWKQLKKHHKWELSYVYRTVFTFIPIIGFLIVVDLFNRIKKLLKQNDVKFKMYPIIMMILFYVLNALYRLPHLYWLLGFLSMIPFVYAQYALNLYWMKVQPDHLVRDKFTKRQWILMVIGGIFWILIIIGLFY